MKIYPIYCQAVHCLNLFGGPDHESLLVLFWSHFESAIEHFYIKKRGFRPCFHGLHGGWRRETGLSPPVKYIYWPFQGGTSFVLFLSCVCYSFARLFIDALWSPTGKGLTSWLSFVVSYCVFLSFSHVVSWVRCGT